MYRASGVPGASRSASSPTRARSSLAALQARTASPPNRSDGATVLLRLAAVNGARQFVAAAFEEYAARLEQQAAQPGRDTTALGARSRAALARSERSDLALLIHH